MSGIKRFLKAREMNGYLGLGMIMLVAALARSARMSDAVLGIAIAIGAGFGFVGAVQTIRRTVTKTNQMNSNLFLGIMLLLVALALGDRISDAILAIALALGLVFQFVGVYQQTGKAKK